MEYAALVAVALLVRAQLAKVLCRLGHHIGAQQHDNASSIIAANAYVEEHLGIALFRLLNDRRPR